MPTDSSLDDSDIQGDTDSSGGKSIASQLEDMKRRFSGQSKTIDRINKENEKLRDQLAQRDSESEQELSNFRNQSQELAKNLKTKESELSALEVLKVAAEKERDRLKVQGEAAKVIAEKYPALLEDHMIGDLKLQSDFSSAEDYDAYLERQSKKSSPATDSNPNDPNPGKGDADAQTLANQLRGATPGASTRMESGSRNLRSKIEISEDMMDLSPVDPKYKELMKELNEATESK